MPVNAVIRYVTGMQMSHASRVNKRSPVFFNDLPQVFE